MADSRKRIALKPHMDRIREWVETGKTDDWIADALGTSASSVQSFRSRNDIYRRERGPREPETVFEGVLDHGERDGWGLWLDPSIAEDPIWKEHWAGVEAVVVKVAEDSIVLEADGGETGSADDFAPSVATPDETSDEQTSGLPRERGRVKWFDAEKGYGFLVRPRAMISSSIILRYRVTFGTLSQRRGGVRGRAQRPGPERAKRQNQ